MPPWLAQMVPVVGPLVGSLVAVLLLARVARWMGLGDGHDRIIDESHAIALAEEAECGFDGITADIDAACFAAIVRNAAGAAMLVRAHGNRFAARRITQGFTARLDRNRLWLDSGERSFGRVELDFGARAPIIASRLREVL